uniref:Lipopolysaccharide assembly protein A domain-containing protein n=1 Tax=Cyanothece sp. (strain PCC 7425 / ATCC 29141) TaxID=395961 RepID=B8HSP0_CYAP4
MRQVNFTLIFVISLALVLFGIENTEPVPINIVQGVTLQAPLCIELIAAMGLGAVFAWVFSVWVNLQRGMTVKQEVQHRDAQIESLKEDLERYQAELEQQQRLLPSATIE